MGIFRILEKKDGEKEDKDLQNKRDRLAKKIYGSPYQNLCKIRKGIIDERLRAEEELKPSTS